MIIFLDSGGSIVATSAPDKVGRNSNDAASVYIVAPFKSATSIYLTFRLPNGQELFGGVAHEGDELPYDAAAQKAAYLFTSSGFSVWRYKIPASVTLYAGNVQYTIVTLTENMRATATGSFTVARGNRVIFPDAEPENAWELLKNQANQNTDAIETLEGEFEDLKNQAPSGLDEIVETISRIEKQIEGKVDEWEGATGSYYTLRARSTDSQGETTTRFFPLYITPLANTLAMWDSNKRLSTATPASDKHCANKEYVDNEGIAIKKRLDLLELAAEGNIFAFVEDDSAAYEKAVPATAFPNATIDKLGGAMGRDEFGLLVESPVTAIENHGKNLFNESAITQAGVSPERWGSSYGVVENGYLKTKIGHNAGAAIWGPFKMNLDKGRYAISADVCVVDAQSLDCYIGVATGTSISSIFRGKITVSAYGVWERKSANVSVTEAGEYFFTSNGYGLSAQDVRFKNIQIEKVDTETATATAFAPYREPITYEIPQAVRNLAGYGLGIDKNINNYIDFEAKTYTQMVDRRLWESADEGRGDILTDAIITVYPLDAPVVTDISDKLTFDGNIEVEQNGAIVAVNEYKAAIPSTITFQVKL